MELSEILGTMLPAASAAYVAMDPAAEVPMPAGYSFVGRIVATGEPEHPLAIRTMADSHIFGFVARDPLTAVVLVSIRGTRTPIEWMDDFEAVPLPFMAHEQYGLVHSGFDHVYNHICASIERLIFDVTSRSKILVTGHSLGGGLTTLLGLDWGSATMEICNFAAPRALTMESVGHFSVACTRIVNKFDIVPNVPLPPLYEHVGLEILVDGGGSLAPADRHGLIAYEAGLKRKIAGG